MEEQNNPKSEVERKRRLSLSEGLMYGGIVGFAMLLALKFSWWLLKEFLDTTEWLRNLIVLLLFQNVGLADWLQEASSFIISLVLFQNVGLADWLQEASSFIISLVLILPLFWLLGHLEISAVLKKTHLWWIEKKTCQKFLFCVNMKDPLSFPGKYPVGCVTKIYEYKAEACYAICFPNLGGFITLIDVPVTDTIYNDRSPAEVILAGFTFGALISGIKVETLPYADKNSKPL